MRPWIATLLALPIAHAAHAQIHCTDAQDQATMTVCANRAYKQSDAELNKTYKAIAARLKDDKPLAQKLIAAQRAWVTFRDAECGFATGNAEGGSIYPMVLAACLDRQTKARTEDLKRYLTCQEGDAGCPVPAR